MRTIKEIKDNLKPRRAMNVLRLASNVADAETITIGSEIYEIDTAAAPGAVATGNIRVDCNAGVTPAIASAAFVAALNANTKYGLTAVAISTNEILVFTNSDSSPIALPCAEALAGANNAWAAAAFYGGESTGIRGMRAAQRS